MPQLEVQQRMSIERELQGRMAREREAERIAVEYAMQAEVVDATPPRGPPERDEEFWAAVVRQVKLSL